MIVIIILLIILLISIICLCKHNREKYNDLDKYILLKLIIPNESDMGGFAWHIHMVLCGIWLAERNGKKLYVLFDEGYYYDRKMGNNWWEYYFKQPYSFSDDEIEMIENAAKRGRTREIVTKDIQTSHKIHLMTNYSFQNAARPNKIDWHEMYQKVILLPDIIEKIETFKKQYFKPKMIGVHYRGTDKYAAYGDGEDGAGPHVLYNRMIQEVRTYNNTWGIFVASDEQPFVDAMKKSFPDRVVMYESSRASISTSGKSMGDTIDCTIDSQDETCKNYFELVKNHSIHRGNNSIPPYKKGLDAIMDIYLLSECNIMFRNAAGGNFSSQPARINPNLQLFSYTNGRFV